MTYTLAWFDITILFSVLEEIHQLSPVISSTSNDNETNRSQCIPIKPSAKDNHLPSSTINKRLLVNPNVIIQKYSSYVKRLDKIPTLACKLAESPFSMKMFSKLVLLQDSEMENY